MAKRDLLQHAASDRAASELDYIIKSEDLSGRQQIPTVTPQQAMNEDRIFHAASSRDVTRVLFVSRDTDLLNPTRQSLDGYINISDLFAEVHILILRPGIAPKDPVLRVAPNVWLYTAAAKHWWQTPAAAMQLVEEQLEFASGFRPDLVVARDPFESAWVAQKIQKKYNCPTQLHVVEDYTTAEFYGGRANKNNFWRLVLSRFTIPAFQSVRTFTKNTYERIASKYAIPDLAVLPRYQNYEMLIDSTESVNLKGTYRPLIFFILFIGPLGYDSTLYQVIDAARFVLRNPRVGLLVLGDGPAREEFEKRAKALGVERQVVFERRAQNVVPYLKSAHILVVSDVTPESEEIVLKGAAAGIPLLLTETDMRDDIFTDGESAFIVRPGDMQSMSDRINDFLNDISVRRQFVEAAQDIIRTEFHSDPQVYLEAYRTSIEQAFFVGVAGLEDKTSDG